MTALAAFRQTVGDLARPFSIYISTTSASIATVRIAWMAHLGNIELGAAALFIGACWGGVGALYWGKVWERKEESKHGAQVAIEQAKASTAPATTVTAPPDASVTVTPATEAANDAGELPPSLRVRP